MEDNQKKNKDLLWKQYEFNADMYKFYFDAYLKYNLFYYAVLSGTLSFVYLNKEDCLVYPLLYVPLILGLGFVFLMIYGSKLIKNIGEELLSLTKDLEVNTCPNTSVLVYLFYLGAVLYIITFFGLWIMRTNIPC